MPNTIQLKRSTTAGSAPTSLADGELALNRADGELYYKDDTNAIVSLLAIDCGEITTGGGGSSLSLWKAELDGNWHWSD